MKVLSGGNQQKVVLAKWLLEPPNLFVLYDVTRGVDVGTKLQIYDLLARLAESGVGILFYTTDINELVNLSHRVYVMADGEVSAELRAPDITEGNVLRAAFASSLHGSGGRRPRRPESAPTRGTVMAQADQWLGSKGLPNGRVWVAAPSSWSACWLLISSSNRRR